MIQILIRIILILINNNNSVERLKLNSRLSKNIGNSKLYNFSLNPSDTLLLINVFT